MQTEEAKNPEQKASLKSSFWRLSKGQKRQKGLMKKLAGAVAIVLIAAIVLIVAWAEMRTTRVEIESATQKKTLVKIRGGEWPSPLAGGEKLRLYAECAAFSEDVYDRKDPTIKPPSGWGQIIHDTPNYPPDQRRIDWSKIDPKNGVQAPEFAFKVWEKPAQDQVNLVIAFRGTDDRKDWTSNFRWFTRKITGKEDQYDWVRKMMPQLMDIIHQRHQGKQLRIVTTGHSLGGGLAQHAAYTTDEIKEVYAFDSSPVTGYYDIEERKKNSLGKKIDRIYERGEILSYARSLLRPFYELSEKDPNITEIGFNFTKGSWAGEQHSMTDLAKNLQEAAR